MLIYFSLMAGFSWKFCNQIIKQLNVDTDETRIGLQAPRNIIFNVSATYMCSGLELAKLKML